MDEQKQKLIERIKQAQNILVTVSANPSVDQLSAAIGLTLTLNKLDKHGTAVFSGNVPSTMEFLKPEETLEKNTDSLRDFIIALDKSKADKLRYKVEDQVVRIFITPYKTSLSEADLEFSQGDFNVDVVIALGVVEQQDLDAAITAHGRILHDASVASVSNSGQGSLGTINWVDPNASSLSEMMASLTDGLDKKVMDAQIATAYLTGIVASTDRFRNEKTSPKTMSASAALMSAGANQQLIATQLETEPEPPEPAADQTGDPNAAEGSEQVPEHKPEPGTLEIEHEPEEIESEIGVEPPLELPEPEHPQIHVDENGQLLIGSQDGPLPEISQVHGVGNNGQAEGGSGEVNHDRLIEPPKMGDVNITANVNPESEEDEASTEELTLPAMNAPLLSHTESVLSPAASTPEPTAATKPVFIPQEPLSAPAPPPPPAWQPPAPETPPPAPVFEPTPLPEPPAPPAPPVFTPPAPQVVQPAPVPTPPTVFSPAPQSAPAPEPAFPAPGTTLSQIEASVDSPHAHPADTPAPAPSATPAPGPDASVDSARSAVEAALSSAEPANEPIAALNAQPLGPDLHAAPLNTATPAPASVPTPAQPAASPFGAPMSTIVPNTGFNEPTPGNTPADDAMDMPLPSNPFGPGQQIAPPAPQSMPGFPGVPGAPLNTAGTPPPPPVPPPMVPPVQ